MPHDQWGQCFVVAENGQWIEGIYSTPDVARRACQFSDRELMTLAHVWRFDRENRPATDEDLDRIVR